MIKVTPKILNLNVYCRYCNVAFDGETYIVMAHIKKESVNNVEMVFYISTKRNPLLAFQCYTAFGKSDYINEDLATLWFSSTVSKQIEEMAKVYNINFEKWMYK